MLAPVSACLGGVNQCFMLAPVSDTSFKTGASFVLVSQRGKKKASVEYSLRQA